MNFLLSFLFIILSVLLILVVLVQPGKGDMISGMGSLGGSFSSVLGSRKAMDFLTRTTIILASLIMVLSLLTNKFFIGQTEMIQKPAVEGTALPPTGGQNIPIQTQEPLVPQGDEQPQQDQGGEK